MGRRFSPQDRFDDAQAPDDKPGFLDRQERSTLRERLVLEVRHVQQSSSAHERRVRGQYDPSKQIAQRTDVLAAGLTCGKRSSTHSPLCLHSASP